MYAPDSDSEGSDPVAVEASGNPSPSQIQAGYNSFGRPSMFAQQSNYNAANQRPRGDEDSSDDSDDDDAVVAVPPIPVPRGKELRLSGKDLPDADSSDDYDDNDDDINEPSKAKVTTIASNTPRRGKVLRLPPKGGDDTSSDDEPLANLKPKNGSKKRKDAPNAGDSDSDDDDDDVVAATVVEGGDVNDVMAVAKVITNNKKVKTNDGKAKKASAAKKSPANKKKSSPAKKSAKTSSSKTKAPDGLPSVPADKAEAAQKARAKLRKNVTSLRLWFQRTKLFAVLERSSLSIAIKWMRPITQVPVPFIQWDFLVIDSCSALSTTVLSPYVVIFSRAKACEKMVET